MSAIKPHLLKSETLTTIFKNLFGDSLKSSYICVLKEFNDSNQILYNYQEEVAKHYNSNLNSINLDFDFTVVLEFSPFKFSELSPASDGEPMFITGFDYSDSIIVS